MSAKFNKAVQVFRDLARIPTLLGGTILPKTNQLLAVSAIWQQRDLDTLEKLKFSRTFSVRLPDLQVQMAQAPQGSDTAEIWCKTSPSGTWCAKIRKVVSKKTQEERYCIEIWSNSRKEKTIDVTALDKHGKVYEADGTFGCLEWSANEEKLLYVAEHKLAKSESFFAVPKKQPDMATTVGESSASAASEPAPAASTTVKGDQHVFVEDWGEQMVGKHHTIVCILDIGSGNVDVIDSIPNHLSPAQPVWCPDGKGVVFVGYYNEPWRLGQIYCTQRRSAIMHFDADTRLINVIEDANCAVKSPRFSPDGTRLVYLECDAGGPHHRGRRLMMCDWTTRAVSTVVDLVQRPTTGSFAGFYQQALPERCWSADSRRVVCHSEFRSQQAIYVICIDTGAVNRLPLDDRSGGSWTVVDVCQDVILATCSSPSVPHYLALGSLPPAGQESNIVWQPLDERGTAIDGITWDILQFTPTEANENAKFPGLSYEGVLLRPTATSDQRPLIVFPHGGPHSTFLAEYSLYFAAMCKLGYTVLLVNYRGSIGFGEDNINSLLGNIGQQEVIDVQDAVESVVANYQLDKNKVVVMGGSHGGLITGILIGRFPEYYKAAVMRNPVTNIVAMMGVTDIPDWCFVECGFKYDQTKPPMVSPEVYNEAWHRSPMSIVTKVKCPTLIILGMEDRRVPNSQGHEFHRALKMLGVTSRLLAYTDNGHAIAGVDAESDSFVNVVEWFNTHV